jgi:hypothetical protein
VVVLVVIIYQMVLLVVQVAVVEALMETLPQIPQAELATHPLFLPLKEIMEDLHQLTQQDN